LADSLSRGAITTLSATTHDEAIAELVAALPTIRLPVGMTKQQITEITLAREEEITTDLGNGIAFSMANHSRVWCVFC
jgi:mannitol/fructose-specific phosphotransferase system IIA component